MIGDADRHASSFVPGPPQAPQRVLRPQQLLRRYPTQGNDHARGYEFDLAVEKGTAGRRFVRLRIPVVRRSALDDVRDVDVLTAQIHGLDDPRQKLARGPHERQALPVLLRARALAHEHQIRLAVAIAEDDRLPRPAKTAGRTAPGRLGDLPQALQAPPWNCSRR